MTNKIILYLISVTLLAILVACRLDMRTELDSVSFVLTNGIVFDGTGADPITDGLVAVLGDRIVAVGQAADFKLPADVVILEAAGGTIMPGVFNAHAHRVASAGTRRHLFLLDGVTSVCDLGDLLARMPDFDQEALESGLAARGFNAGPIVTVPGGYPGPILGPINYDIQGEIEGENAVQDLHGRGADYIKVALEPGPFFNEYLPVLNLQELSAIVATAHAQGLLVRAHVTNSAMLDIALEAGVDVIEHVPVPYDSDNNLVSRFDDAEVYRLPSELETQLLRMINQEMVLVPTLDVLTGEAFLRGEIGSEPDMFIQAVLGVVSWFHDSGGIIAVGNDYGNPGVQPGMPLHEMDLLQTAGLSPIEVLEAATRHAAYVCGQSNELGTLEIGKKADLIVVDGNPLGDLKTLDSILYVVKNGEIVISPPQES